VDDAITACGDREHRSDGEMPAHVITLGRGVVDADLQSDHPGPETPGPRDVRAGPGGPVGGPVGMLAVRTAVGTARGPLLRGWRLVAIDGFELDLPDSADNAAQLGYAGSGDNPSGWTSNATSSEWCCCDDQATLELGESAATSRVWDDWSMIELCEVITQLRSELEESRKAGDGEDLRLELGPVELEVNVAIQKVAGVGAKVKFWVVELGTDGKLSATTTQRVKLTLQPRLTAAAAAAEPAISPDRAYVSGKREKRER